MRIWNKGNLFFNYAQESKNVKDDFFCLYWLYLDTLKKIEPDFSYDVFLALDNPDEYFYWWYRDMRHFWKSYEEISFVRG